jgi:hypothetical protein
VKTIYISIPSLNDTETKVTVENAFLAADSPERIFVGVSVLDVDTKVYDEVVELSNKYKNIKSEFILLDTTSTNQFGTGNGRQRAAAMYSGEDYMLQIDSHTHFTKGWDTYLIDLFEEAAAFVGKEELVLTGYLGNYRYNPVRGWMDIHDIRYPFYLPEEFFLNSIPAWDLFVVLDTHKDKFIPCVKFNGNFAFGNKKFVENSGRDPESIFYDEEMIQSINLIGNDFAMVFPNVSGFPLTHLYTDHINEHGGNRMYYTEYLEHDLKEYSAKESVDRYLNFINNPSNREFVIKYQKYAKINLKKGAISYNYVPRKFFVEV